MTLTAKNLPSEIETVGDIRAACSIIQAGFSKMRREVNKVIVGQGRVVDLVLVAVFADGHALLEGPPGLGKTLLVRTLGDVLQLSTGRIQ
ncbi:MAG: AAA family ATPase, partial [Phycisphaerales bacterium]|nr:AAA family ATPase [Phycisphaerales bacterium]